MSTGYYLRVQRDGKWVNLCVEDLTNAEIKERFGPDSPKGASEAWRWIAGLADVYRETVGLPKRDTGEPTP